MQIIVAGILAKIPKLTTEICNLFPLIVIMNTQFFFQKHFGLPETKTVLQMSTVINPLNCSKRSQYLGSQQLAC